MQMLAQLETITGRKAQHGLFVINMEYGRNFSGPDKDVFFYDRSVGHTEDAWQSNFLHPVIYYYRHLPTGEPGLCCPLRTGFRTRHCSDPTVYHLPSLSPHPTLPADRGHWGTPPRNQMGRKA